MAVLEVCCYSMACAREAERCGADRIELCAAPQEGGLTPSYGVLVSAREAGDRVIVVDATTEPTDPDW